MKEELSRYQAAHACETCHGARLKPEALAVKIAGEDISLSARRSVHDALAWFRGLEEQLGPQQREIARAILKEINERLGFLDNVGLDYLNLDRTSGTLSGGESQRIRLAIQIGAGLSGVLYVLDEPSIGLHQKDNDRLLETLKRLKSLGNTVLVVEHDEDAIRHADHIIDMGPGAGVRGGEVVCAGTLDQLLACEDSLTADYLSGRRSIPFPPSAARATARSSPSTALPPTICASVTASIPLGTFTCITGVSGSGKSSFTIDTLYAAAARALNGARILAGKYDKITGLEHLDKVIDIDQSPIGRTPRSNPATYTGAFTQIRDWFAGLPESQARGYKPGPLLLQRQGRPLRGLHRRRPAQDRDALPPRRLRHLRRLPRPALQSRDAGGEVQGQEHRRGARHDGRGRGRILQGGPRHPRQDGDAPGSRPRLRQGRPAGDDASAAARPSASSSPRNSRAAPPARRSTSSTSRPPASISRTSASCSKCSTRWSSRATPSSSSSTTSTSSRPPTGSSTLGPDGGVKGGEIVAVGTPETIAAEPRSATGHYLKPLLDKPRADMPILKRAPKRAKEAAALEA